MLRNKLFRLLLALFIFMFLTTTVMVLFTQNFSHKPALDSIDAKTRSGIEGILRVTNGKGTNKAFINTESSKTNLATSTTELSKSSMGTKTTDSIKSNTGTNTTDSIKSNTATRPIELSKSYTGTNTTLLSKTNIATKTAELSKTNMATNTTLLSKTNMATNTTLLSKTNTATKTAEESKTNMATKTPESSTRNNSPPKAAGVTPHATDGTPTPTTVTPRPLLCQGCFLTNFTVLLENAYLCAPSNGTQPEMIMMVTTSLTAQNYRQAIRDTWASVTKGNTANIRHVFLLGTTTDAAVWASIREESSRYQDLVVTDFADTYDHLTYKTMSGLHWIVQRCGHVRFFLKTDQDMYVFPHKLLALSQKHERNLTVSLGGHCHRNHQPWRGLGTRYYVSNMSYPQHDYPDFCSGTGYLGTLTLARTMVKKSVDVPFFYLEDIYMALVLQALGYDITCFLGFVETPWKCYQGNGAIVMTIHERTPQQMRSYWRSNICGSRGL